MYTIKAAALRSGVGAPLIRAWERRYGVPKPTRTTSGYRLYDDATIELLRTMRALIESGWTASEAARAIGAGEIATVTGNASPEAPGEDRGNRSRMIERFVAAAESTSPADTEAVLDDIFGSGSFEAIVDDLLMPSAAAMGESWVAGRLSVGSEHAASAAIARRLSAVYQAAGVPARPSVAVGLPPGGRHELGALAFAAALRRRGIGVLYVGPDVTVEGWVDAVRRSRARAAVMGVVTPADRAAADAVIAALREAGVGLIALGGAAAGAPGANDMVILPPRVVDAAVVIAEALGRRR
jgi:DNA-binding transcriptional MerR regulator/methylmalonyl-CoA mutase cobalamin-binding subunit